MLLANPVPAFSPWHKADKRMGSNCKEGESETQVINQP